LHAASRVTIRELHATVASSRVADAASRATFAHSSAMIMMIGRD
jgi:hypothetical protein